MIEVQDLHISYGSREILKGVNFKAHPGELIFILGANGAGKTTLMRCLLGHLPGYSGKILLDGCSSSSFTPKELAKRIAYIPQTHHMVFSYSVLDMVLMGTNHRLSAFASPGKQERELAMQALEQMGIGDFAPRSFQHLSGGEKQLVLVARALAQQAKILLMDEPTSALDFGNQVRVFERVCALAHHGYTILLSCHNPQHAMLYAQRVIAISDGIVAADGPPQKALNAALIRKLYGVPARFVETDDGVLIAPVRKSMFHWTPDMISFMRDAAGATDAYAKMADAIANILPADCRVCDAGCGIGTLGVELARRFDHVIAADIALAPLQTLQQTPIPHLEVRQCDVFSPSTPLNCDAMVFCNFAKASEIQQALQKNSCHLAVVLKRTAETHRFRLEATPKKRGNSFEKLCEDLTQQGICYQTQLLCLEMGQPFRTLEDAVLFFQTYSRDEAPELINIETVQSRLVRRQDAEFPWYLPSRETFGMLWFQLADQPEKKEKELC